ADEHHVIESAEVVRPAHARVLRIGLPIQGDGVTQLIAGSYVAAHGLNAARIGPLVHHEQNIHGGAVSIVTLVPLAGPSIIPRWPSTPRSGAHRNDEQPDGFGSSTRRPSRTPAGALCPPLAPLRR